MVTLRCTQKLLRRLKLPFRIATGPSTTALGDWYANLLFTRPQQLILCVSERSLLSVVLYAKEPHSLESRFRETVRDVLHEIGAPCDAINREEHEMTDLAFGPTSSRKVLGSMNELTRQLEWLLHSKPELSLIELSVKLSEVPCGPIGMRFPMEVALELLNQSAGSGH